MPNSMGPISELLEAPEPRFWPKSDLNQLPGDLHEQTIFGGKFKTNF